MFWNIHQTETTRSSIYFLLVQLIDIWRRIIFGDVCFFHWCYAIDEAHNARYSSLFEALQVALYGVNGTADRQRRGGVVDTPAHALKSTLTYTDWGSFGKRKSCGRRRTQTDKLYQSLYSVFAGTHYTPSAPQDLSRGPLLLPPMPSLFSLVFLSTAYPSHVGCDAAKNNWPFYLKSYCDIRNS